MWTLARREHKFRWLAVVLLVVCFAVPAPAASAAEPLAPRLSQGDELMLAAAACYATGQVRLP